MHSPEQVPDLMRSRLPTDRSGRIFRLSIGTEETIEAIVEHVLEEGEAPTPSKIKCYLITGEYEDGSLGEVFCIPPKEGTLLKGLLDGFAQMISVSLQYGIPLDVIISRFMSTRFGPQGITGDAQIPMASSVFDLIFRKLALRYLTQEQCDNLNIVDHSLAGNADDSKGCDKPSEPRLELAADSLALDLSLPVTRNDKEQDDDEADNENGQVCKWIEQEDGSWLNVNAQACKLNTKPTVPDAFSKGSPEADREGGKEGGGEQESGGEEAEAAGEASKDMQTPEASEAPRWLH